MVVVFLAFVFSTSHHYFFGIFDNDEITTIDVGSKSYFLLTHQFFCNFGCQTTQYLTSGINFVPLTSHVLFALGKRLVIFHAYFSPVFLRVKLRTLTAPLLRVLFSFWAN
ncbi:hypothetical protein SDC9_187624 [bioreactor metagenome]|uniref:Uncharacterized protein n=1 Tax=bioreactor metagenome TaxID=1076179 RepID=A0A645HPB8_9ZZZZ